MEPIYLSIKQKETGTRIRHMLMEKGYTVRDVQEVMGFENPQAVYKWLSGKSLPSLENLLILSKLLNKTMEEILVIDGGFHFMGFSLLSEMEFFAVPKNGISLNI